MLTYEDFLAIGNVTAAISRAIREHVSSAEYKTAMVADEYDRQRNATIAAYRQTLYNVFGDELTDFTASDNRIASNFFSRLNTQRVMYSLGNGVSFADDNGEIKEQLGPDFDFELARGGLCACKHGKSFLFWNLDHAVSFKLTEFVPLWDEEDGTLKAVELGLHRTVLTTALGIVETALEEYRRHLRQTQANDTGEREASLHAVVIADIARQLTQGETHAGTPVDILLVEFETTASKLCERGHGQHHSQNSCKKLLHNHCILTVE